MSFSTTVKETFGTRDSKLEPSQSLILKKKSKMNPKLNSSYCFCVRQNHKNKKTFSKTYFIKLKIKQIWEKSKR